MTDGMREKISERIRNARKAKNLSQQALGDLLEVSFQAVSTWEQGKFIPDADHLPALAGLLGTLACLLVFGPEGFLIPAMLVITFVLTLLRSRIADGKGAEL